MPSRITGLLALSVFRRQVQRLASAGCTLVGVPLLQDIQSINDRHGSLIAGEIARVHAAWFDTHRDRYRRATREIIDRGRSVGDADLDDLRRSCIDLRETIAASMRTHAIDAWVCPSTTEEAPPGLASTGSPLMNLPWTHAGLPAITVAAGRPLGLQLVGGFMTDEALAVRIAPPATP